MNDPNQRRQPWSVSVAFVAGDALKTIKGAPGANKRLVVINTFTIITTLAAQAFDITDTSGTTIVDRFPASAAVGRYQGAFLEEGLKLVVNEALVYKPAAAGVAGLIIAEGWIEG